jgi:hypothetical protein
MVNVKIGDKVYSCVYEPFFQKTKNSTVTLEVYDLETYPDHLIDHITISKMRYEWALVGCKLITCTDISNSYPSIFNKKVSKLTISFEKRLGSHSPGVLKSDIRNYLISKVFKTN